MWDIPLYTEVSTWSCRRRRCVKVIKFKAPKKPSMQCYTDKALPGATV